MMDNIDALIIGENLDIYGTDENINYYEINQINDL